MFVFNQSSSLRNRFHAAKKAAEGGVSRPFLWYVPTLFICLVDYLSIATHEFQDLFFSMCMHMHAYAHMHLDILNEYVTHFCFEPLINIRNKMANNNSNIHIYDTFSLFNTAQFFRGITHMIVEQNTITFLFVLHDFIIFYLTIGIPNMNCRRWEIFHRW